MSEEQSNAEYSRNRVYKWTRRLSHDETSRQWFSTERHNSRRYSSFEATRRLSAVGKLSPLVDIYDSDSDDVPEIDYSDPIHYTKRVSVQKPDVVPSYKDLLGDEGVAVYGASIGKAAAGLKTPTSRKKGKKLK